MNFADVYLVAAIRNIDECGYALMYTEGRIQLCEYLDVTPGKLEEILDLAFSRKYIQIDEPFFSYRVVVTDKGRIFAGIQAESEVTA